MQRPDEHFNSRAHSNGVKPLPLFRPEAILYQQQKSLGEIILIRPLSLWLLTWLTVGILALALGFLFLGHYTDRLRFEGSLVATGNPGELTAELYVPDRLLSAIPPGTTVVLRCRACPSPAMVAAGTIRAFAPGRVSARSGTKMAAEPITVVNVSLPAEARSRIRLNPVSAQPTPVEAEITLGRKPLIKWLFERSAS